MPLFERGAVEGPERQFVFARCHQAVADLEPVYGLLCVRSTPGAKTPSAGRGKAARVTQAANPMSKQGQSAG